MGGEEGRIVEAGLGKEKERNTVLEQKIKRQSQNHPELQRTTSTMSRGTTSAWFTTSYITNKRGKRSVRQ